MCMCVWMCKSGTGSQQEKECIHNLCTNSYANHYNVSLCPYQSSATSFHASLFLFIMTTSFVFLVVCPVAGSPEGSTQGNV